MKIAVFLFAVMLLTHFSVPAHACNLTLSPGANLHNAVAVPSHTVCLNAGTYSLSATLYLAQGVTLKGLGSSRDDVVIRSSADRIVVMDNNTTLHNLKVLNAPGSLPTFGVITYYDTGVLLWGLRIQGNLINIAVNVSSDVTIADTFTSVNGIYKNGIAEPNIWISSAHNVSIQWGEARGRGDGPSGDGEISCFDSTSVNIYGTHVVDSGASGIYFVNCDSSSIQNATIHRANEWGIDVVQGSDGFVAKDNVVYWSNYGGAVFDEAGSAGGSFIGNYFHSNRQMNVGNCNGVNVIGSVAGVYFSGNTTNGGSAYCTYK